MASALSNSAAAAARRAWLEERRKGLGGSDVAALFGVHPWESPYSLWLDKTGQTPLDAREDDVRLEVGKELEPLTRRLYMRETGRFVVPGGNEVIFDKECPWLCGSLDGRVDSDDNSPSVGTGVFEGKTAMIFVKGAWDKGAIPLYIQIQVQTYMAVTGYTWGSVACLVLGAKEPLIIRDVARNNKFIAALRFKASEFWETYVLTGNPPPVDGSAATTRALKALYPEDTGQVVTLSADAVSAWGVMEESKAGIKALEKRRDHQQNIVRNDLGDASYGLLGDGTGISYKTTARSGYSVKAGRSRSMRAASEKVMGRAVEDAPEHVAQRDTKLMQDLKASLVDS